ncbi:4209_t:CDS:2, partial [Gigaspora margarita]
SEPDNSSKQLDLGTSKNRSRLRLVGAYATKDEKKAFEIFKGDDFQGQRVLQE